METTTIELINKLGLHARAASKLSSICAQFASKITISKEGKAADGKSIMALMLLAAPVGSQLEVCCNGEDEQQALQAIVELVQDRFGESE
jgi:phosphocarrier protein